MASKLPKVWEPAYIEAKLALKAHKHGYEGTEPDLSEEDQEKVMELVAMMTDEVLLGVYPTEGARAVALGTNAQRVKTLKATKLYKDALIQALTVKALEGTAQALPNMAAKASDREDNNAVGAFDKLMRVGGLGTKTAMTITKNSTNKTEVHVTFDQQVQGYLSKRNQAKIVDEKP